MPAAMEGKPAFDRRMLVGAVVVNDDVDVKLSGDILLDTLQEAQVLLMTVAVLAFGEHLPLAMSSAAKSVVVPWRS